ncbi:LysR family transcriptional regulator [Phormidium tenue FACHB-886]|nr:LysR family transcriptional regulator [Phormidium tenue FACHB-886]
MNLEGIKLSQLRALVAVAEYGNFSEAALSLALSQSAVSHAIATLEDELGVVLFARGRHGATLTPIGERILVYAQEMLRLLDRMGTEANRIKGLQGGEVRLGSFRSAATHVLPIVIAQFRERYPAIGVSLYEYNADAQVEQELREGRIDIGMTVLPTSSEFEVWEMLRDEYLVLFPPRFKVPNTPLTWEELSQYPLILPPEDDSCRLRIQNHLGGLRQRLEPAYEVREDSTTVSMVRQGLGVAILPRLAAEPLPPDIQLRSLPTPLERVMGVATLAEASQTPATYAFLETLKQISRSLAESTEQPEESHESRKHQVTSTAMSGSGRKVRQL